MKGKIAVIGDGDSVLAFRVVGVDTYSVESVEDAFEKLTNIAKDYQIIFITDIFAEKLEEQIKELSLGAYPVIISIPSKNGSNGYGMKNLKTEAEKALGVDILFNDW